MMRYGSLFAGVGGFDLGLDAAGMECGWQVEWDVRASSVLAWHWPDVPRWGDIRDVHGAELPPVDLVSFGSPCQDLSLAGRRAGLAGERSGLFHEATRVIGEMRGATDGRYPTWAVWENVVGAFSSNRGADFAAVLEGLADLGAHLVEWGVLDAQHFGVPQRRRRIFAVACLDPATARRCPDPLLPVVEGSRRDIAARKKQQRELAGNIASGIGVHRRSGHGKFLISDDAGTVSSRGHDGRTPALITFSRQSNSEWVDSEISATVDTRNSADRTAALIAFGHTNGRTPQPSETVPPTLRAGSGGAAILAHNTVRRLTPVECERLMGWTDDHTRWTADGKEQPDTTRYKQIGNGVVAPVAEWIGRQLLEAGK